MADQPAQHRIAKLLARAGVASRRDVERMIADGRVAVNGSIIDTPATLLATLDGVTVDGAPVAAAEPTRLFLFHKPAGYLTAARDPAGRPTIYDRLPADLPRLVPVGRLDLNTEGLLLLTTDGEFKRQLELPSTGVERAYRARAYGDVTQAQLEELIDGVEIERVRYGSIDANLERRTGANVWVEMILTEGKNREVRRVLEYLGLQVSRLIRTRYGPFVMGDLPVGAIGEVRVADLVAFRQSLKVGSRGKTDAATTISAPALRRTTNSRTVRPAGNAAGFSSADSGYDPAAATRRTSVSEPDRRLRRGDPASGKRDKFGPGPENIAARIRPDRAGGSSIGNGERATRSGPRSAGAVSTDAPRSPRPARGAMHEQTPQRTRSPVTGMTRDAALPQRGGVRLQGSRAPDTSRPSDEDTAQRPVKLQRKPGWAKPKPKTGPRTGKPRK
ncbi:pseudouridine synthase [uncultured Sphingomonas sp.]|uniref:pseudouridine synthase n=1 Tax=uncultured Sphingomonas sp. TaxID=158754 RepID=UPI00262E1F9C|nr:pseudouridine synthase [uncultured Sphingomonas sp.]